MGKDTGTHRLETGHIQRDFVSLQAGVVCWYVMTRAKKAGHLPIPALPNASIKTQDFGKNSCAKKWMEKLKPP